MGQPGSYREPLPRSPNARVLPPSKEPGLWSADRPKGVRQREPDELFTIFGHEMFLKDTKDFGTIVSAETCAQSIDDTARFPNVRRLLDPLTDKELECLAFRLYGACLQSMEERAESNRDTAIAKALREQREHHERQALKECGSVDLESTNVNAAHRGVMTAWENTYQSWLRK